MAPRTTPPPLGMLLAVWFAGHLHAPTPAEACTTFFQQRGPQRYVGKSYDWDIEPGVIFANPSGLRKQAFMLLPSDQGVTWTARYGSVTFNQYGRDFPNGGMNDAGLVIEVMWLDDTVLPPADARPGISELQWIQYQLDTKRSVAELVSSANEVRVVKGYGKVHYMACDPTAACAVFEHLDGKLVVRSQDTLPTKVLTNHPYDVALAALRTTPAAAPTDMGSLPRFVRAAKQLGSKRTPEQILDGVRAPDYTQWNIIYDLSTRTIRFRTRSHASWKSLRPSAVIGRCDAGLKVLDMAHAKADDVTAQFAPYNEKANEALVAANLTPMVKSLAPRLAARLSAHTSSAACVATP